MPMTYNGVGTRYHGKKNVQQRRGACPFCSRVVDLTSYDTRLWFVVLYIPIIPLGRKRILDQCPSCRRHYAVEADRWETAKQLEVSGALENYRANPTPESAVSVHQQLINFHQLEEAAAFRKMMAEKYSDNAKVQAYLGAAMERFQKHEEAATFYRRALELRSDLPEARVGVARQDMRAGRLNEAHSLLDFLEKPGAAQLYSLEPLETLGHAYQKQNRHEEAMAIFAKLQEALPKISEHGGFRKTVKKSEKALGKTETMLLKQKFSFKRLFQVRGAGQVGRVQVTWRSLMVLGIIAAVVMLGFVIANEHIRRNRTLHIVNAYSQAATVQIPGVGNITRIHQLQDVQLSEGHYHAVISGPIQQEVDFDLRASYFSRWFSDPAWVLNIGGATVIMEQQVTYARNPPPANLVWHFGKTFEMIPRVTHPFQSLPPTVSMPEGETRMLVGLEIYSGDGPELFNYLAVRRNPGDALKFAESWLSTHAADEEVLRLYAATAESRHETNRLETFIHGGLSARPVRTEWHRLYEDLHNTPSGHAALVAEYENMLTADPTNSALIYLRGRIESDRDICRDYFNRAAQADQNNPFPLFALGYDHMAAGDWAGAKPLMAQAAKLDPNDSGFEHWLLLSRLALGEAPAVEQEMRKQLAHDPVDALAVIRLIDALAMQNRRDDALHACQDYEKANTAKFGSKAHAVAAVVRSHTYYSVGDFAELERNAKAEHDPEGRLSLAEALIEQGRTDEAVKSMTEEDGLAENPLIALALAVANRQSGNAAEAQRWTEKARQTMQKNSENYANVVKLLDDPATPTLKQAEDLSLPPDLKAVLVAELALQHPDARAALAPLALRLNVERNFPFHLVQRTMSQKQ
jgi:tetratricopeptide (TPR) repeat protein